MKSAVSRFLPMLAQSGVICLILGAVFASSSSAVTEFSASGTYTYTPGTLPQPLPLTWTASNFVCKGPTIGTSTENVTSLTATAMIWTYDDNTTMTWSRASGADGDVTGTWTATDPTLSNSYTAIVNGDGTMSLTATINQCGVSGPPSIISFTPNNGMVGNLVTINGSNFSPIGADNTVQFNGSPAVVKGVHPGQLYVLVPAGATTGTISVTNSGGTVTSSTPFTVATGTPAATLASFKRL